MRFDDQSFNRPPRPEPPIEQFPAVHTGQSEKADPDSVSLNVIADELNDNVGRLRSDVHKSTSTLLNEMQKLGDLSLIHISEPTRRS